MKRLILIAITCIVVDQSHKKYGYLTKCKGIEVDGQVVFEKKVMKGQQVTYRPFIVDHDEFIHGEILAVGDAPMTVEHMPPVESEEEAKAP